MISENEDNKRAVFSEWEDCDCNECEHYWDSSCDGVTKDTKKPCNQFLATRSVVIPKQIERLENQVEKLTLCLAACILLETLHIIGGLF